MKVAGFIILGTSLAVVLLTSCSQQKPPATGEPLIVSSAASTKEVMEALAKQFNAQSQTEVKLNLGPSSGLAGQILAGAPADVFLSASQEWADAIAKAGQAEAIARLLTNQLVIVVPKGNPGQVHEPKDLLSPQVQKISLAGEKVPAGMYADQSLTKLGLLQQLTDAGKIVRGQDVRTALTYVETGEVEAGIVYSTDVGVTSKVESVYEFDPKLHDDIVYVLVLLKHSGDNSQSREFYEFLQSSEAKKVYTTFGFTRLP
jgi:molybdate transport system substrate-binding protein